MGGTKSKTYTQREKRRRKPSRSSQPNKPQEERTNVGSPASLSEVLLLQNLRRQSGRTRRLSMPRTHQGSQLPRKTSQWQSCQSTHSNDSMDSHGFVRRPLAIRYGQAGAGMERKSKSHPSRVKISRAAPKAVKLFVFPEMAFLACAGHMSSASPASSNSCARSNNAE